MRKGKITYDEILNWLDEETEESKKANRCLQVLQFCEKKKRIELIKFLVLEILTYGCLFLTIFLFGTSDIPTRILYPLSLVLGLIAGSVSRNNIKGFIESRKHYNSLIKSANYHFNINFLIREIREKEKRMKYEK